MEPHKRPEEVAEQAAEEPDADKVVEMSQELIKTLDEETNAKLENSNKSEDEQAGKKPA